MAAFSDIVTFTRSSVGYYWDSSGNLVKAAVNVPRFDYTAMTGRLPGLLVEPAETELNLYSVVNDTRYGDVGCTHTNLSLNALGVFSGVSVISAGSVNDRFRILNANGATVTAGSTYKVEVYYRAGTSAGMRVSFNIVGNGSTTHFGGNYGNFTSITTALGTASLVSDDLLKDGVTRRTRLLFVPNASGVMTTAMGPNSSTVGDSVVFLGLFVQAGTVFTTPIITSGATVTRAADVATVTNVSTWFDNSKGTLYGNFRFNYSDTGIGNEVQLFRLTSGGYLTTGHSVNIGTVSTATGRPNYQLTNSSGTNSLNGNPTEVSPGSAVAAKVAVSFDSGVMKIATNGGSAFTMTPVGSPPDVSGYNLTFGGTAPLTILSFNCIPNTVDNATLTSLTV